MSHFRILFLSWQSANTVFSCKSHHRNFHGGTRTGKFLLVTKICWQDETTCRRMGQEGLTCLMRDPEQTWSQMLLSGNWLEPGGPPVRKRRLVTADDGYFIAQYTNNRCGGLWQMVDVQQWAHRKKGLLQHIFLPKCMELISYFACESHFGIVWNNAAKFYYR